MADRLVALPHRILRLFNAVLMPIQVDLILLDDQIGELHLHRLRVTVLPALGLAAHDLPSPFPLLLGPLQILAIQ